MVSIARGLSSWKIASLEEVEPALTMKKSIAQYPVRQTATVEVQSAKAP
jgi:hypothetical protein